MRTLGNDVVDIKAEHALGKSRDVRFVSRVLTSEEQGVMNGAADPDACLWAMWAAKETAYKALSRVWPKISSSPRRYQTMFENPDSNRVWTGCVTAPRGAVHVRVQMDENFVHCIGQSGSGHPEKTDYPAAGAFFQTLDPVADVAPKKNPGKGSCLEGVIWRVFETAAIGSAHIEPDPTQQSAAVHRAACAAIAERLGVTANAVCIQREKTAGRPGPPVVKIRGSSMKIPVSISHHGRFGAFAFHIPTHCAAMGS